MSKVSRPQIHPGMITFPNGTSRINWKAGWAGDETLPYEEWSRRVDEMGILSDLRREAMTTDVRISMMVTWTTTWVGKPQDDWKNRPGHAWGMAVINLRKPDAARPYGKAVLIWDPDPPAIGDDGKPKTSTLMGIQTRMFDNLRAGARNWSVWLGGGTGKGEGFCLRETSEWLLEAVEWDNGPLGGSGDPRLDGFVFVGGDKSHQG